MSLQDFASTPDETHDRTCPSCQEVGEHLRATQYMCTTNRKKCETISWFETKDR